MQFDRESLVLELLRHDELPERDALVCNPPAEESHRHDDRRPDDERGERTVTPAADDPEDERSDERDERPVPRAERDGHRAGDRSGDGSRDSDHGGRVCLAERGQDRGLGEEREPDGQRAMPARAARTTSPCG